MSDVQVVKIGKGLKKRDMVSLQAVEGETDELFAEDSDDGGNEDEEEQDDDVKDKADENFERELREAAPIVDSAERRGLIMKVNSYKNHERIGKLLKDHKISSSKFNVESLSVAELNGILEDIRLHVSAKNSTSFNSMAFDIAISTYEHTMTQYSPYNLSGMSNIINSKHPEVQQCLDELTLEYQSFVHIPPQYRLLSVVLLATAQVAAANESGVKIGVKLERPVSSSIKTKYNDL